MNEDSIKEFCEACIDFCNMHKIGIYMILSHKEGLVHVNKFPPFSVLQHTKDNETVNLVNDDDEHPKDWFQRVENTIVYLDTVSTECKETAELMLNLKNALETALLEAFPLENSSKIFH